jgi:uncharacterized protein (TIGR00299 family) protein
VKRGALVGTKAHVDIEHHHEHGFHHHHGDAHHHHEHHHEHGHTHWSEIRAMLKANLSGDVLARAMAIFERVAVVEAKLHGNSVEDVAFHEIGAVDSIVDIVGAAAGLAWLAPTQVTARRVPLGGGTVKTAHGVLPVPAPATLEILQGADVEAGTPEEGELTTPTGAAILAATVKQYGPMPPAEVRGVGWGAGDRELNDRPNLLRVVVGRAVAQTRAGECVVVEANIDDMNPELTDAVFDALFMAGALDVWVQPITMKKGRPALQLSALCEPAARDAVSAALLAESTTIGVRHRTVERTVLPRRIVEVDTPWGRVKVKLAGPEGAPLNVAPEYEDCRRLARAAGVPVKRVYLAALAAYDRR